jgi:hypothetical protein
MLEAAEKAGAGTQQYEINRSKLRISTKRPFPDLKEEKEF